MIRYELTKFDASFDSLKSRLENRDNSLASLYEALLPWTKACREEDYPESYKIFVEEGNYSSWHELEESLQKITLIENSDNRVVLEEDNSLIKHLFMLRLTLINGANLSVTVDGKLVPNSDEETLEYVFGLYNIRYSFSETKLTLEHMEEK